MFNLYMILIDIVKMKEYQEDFEMFIDFMYRIVWGYQGLLDLWLIWLQNMVGKYVELGNYVEVVQCMVYVVVFVVEYFVLFEDYCYLFVGCVFFQNILFNVLEEFVIFDDILLFDEEGFCFGKYFIELGLVGLLEQVVGYFIMGGFYEVVNEVYKNFIFILEVYCDYKKLVVVYGKLQEVFIKIMYQSFGWECVFGMYFCVGFYGVCFGDLDEQEFVYKELLIMKLVEILYWLEEFYMERFGDDVVEIIKDFNFVDKFKFDVQKVYIQIMYVELYFDIYEFKDWVIYFDCNYGFCIFLFCMFFMLDGCVYGELFE